MVTEYYDIIGDVHGHATLLKKLLKNMGYAVVGGVWKHPKRKVIFIGDFINRGPEIRETIQIVRSMHEAGTALAILGNHEYSAILYYIKDSRGVYLSKHIAGNRNQIQSTVTAFLTREEEWRDHRKWLRTLPLFLDLQGIRLVHAYWNNSDLNYLKSFLPEGRLKKDFLRTIHEKQHPSAVVILRILKGLDFKCPSDLILKCSEGLSRKSFRINWWESPHNKTFRSLAFGNKFTLPEYTVPRELAPSFEPYDLNDPPVFVGHYNLSEGASILQENICCVDSGVAGNEILSAYRWSGEAKLIAANIVSVSAI